MIQTKLNFLEYIPHIIVLDNENRIQDASTNPTDSPSIEYPEPELVEGFNSRRYAFLDKEGSLIFSGSTNLNRNKFYKWNFDSNTDFEYIEGMDFNVQHPNGMFASSGNGDAFIFSGWGPGKLGW